jgi:catechol 2,3-dioxygenase-like lactoylglutathione lyase family enzyme
VKKGHAVEIRLGTGCIGLLGLGGPGFHLEISSSDVDALHAQLIMEGMTPEGPPEDRPWGERTFNVIDPDGNHLEFADDALSGEGLAHGSASD